MYVDAALIEVTKRRLRGGIPGADEDRDCVAHLRQASGASPAAAGRDGRLAHREACRGAVLAGWPAGCPHARPASTSATAATAATALRAFLRLAIDRRRRRAAGRVGARLGCCGGHRERQRRAVRAGGGDGASRRAPGSPSSPALAARRPGRAGRGSPRRGLGCDTSSRALSQPPVERDASTSIPYIELVAAAQRRAVADARDQSLGSRDRDVEAVGDPEEADPPALVRAHQRDDHDVLLASLERVDGVDLHGALETPPAECLAEPFHLLRVHRDHRHAQLAGRALVEQPHDLRGNAHLRLVAQRTAGTASLAATAHSLGVDEVECDRERLAGDVVVGLDLGRVLELVVVRRRRHVRRDVRVHAVLDGEQALGLGGKPAIPALLEQAPVDEVLERGVGLDDAVESVVLDRRQLLVVTHQREAATETQRRKRLVGACLVRLVEDDDVEVHVGDARRRGGRAGREVAVGLEKTRVVLVIEPELVDRRMHALGAGDPDGAHSRGPGEALERVVDREVAVRRDQDPLVGVGCQSAFDGFDDHRRLAGAGRSLDEHRLARAEAAEQPDRAILRLVGPHPGGQPGGFGVRLVLGRDDGFRADQQLGEQPDAEVLGGDGREHRALCLVAAPC